jgi:hypothetical protein
VFKPVPSRLIATRVRRQTLWDQFALFLRDTFLPIANSEAGADAMVESAIEQAYRAVNEIRTA